MLREHAEASADGSAALLREHAEKVPSILVQLMSCVAMGVRAASLGEWGSVGLILVTVLCEEQPTLPNGVQSQQSKHLARFSQLVWSQRQAFKNDVYVRGSCLRSTSFVSSTGNLRHQHFGPHEEVEELFDRWKHWTLLSTSSVCLTQRAWNARKVDNITPQKIFSSPPVVHCEIVGLQERRLLRAGKLDEKVAKLHIPRSVQTSDQIVPSLVRRSPCRSCAGSASD